MRIEPSWPSTVTSTDNFAENKVASNTIAFVAEVAESTTAALDLSEGFAARQGTDLTRAQFLLASLDERSQVDGFGQPSEARFDGHLVGAGGLAFPPGTPLSVVPAVNPLKGRTNNETILYINGLNEPVGLQSQHLQNIADATGSRTIGVHNATKGRILDVLQSVGDKLGISQNPATESLADIVYNEIKAGRGVHLLAHSQGAIITSNALSAVTRRLQQDGFSTAQTEALLSRVKVETTASIATRFPNGPQYVHYINKNDSIASAFGLSSSLSAQFAYPFVPVQPGRGAVMHYFNAGTSDSAHSLTQSYLPQREPFEQARAKGNN